MECFNCPRKCGVNRETNLGFCKLNSKLKIAKACLHFGEEPIISGKNGSGTIFFSGCSLKCVFCQNYSLSHQNFGKEIDVKRLVQIFKELEKNGANNINLVTPTLYINLIIEALKLYKPKVPIVYNTSGYENVEQIKALNGFVDIYLTDFKLISENLSQKYLNAKDYFEKTSCAIKEMLTQQPKVVIKNNLMKKGVIIRHLVMPNLTKESIKVLNYISKNYSGFLISLMSQFTPTENCKNYIEINRKLKPLEYKVVLNKAIELNLNGFMQELNSATTKEIPIFNLQGV